MILNPGYKATTSQLNLECCSKLRSRIIGDCCCKWLVPDFSEFPFKFAKDLNNGKDKTWSCGQCEFGFICEK